MALGLRRCPRTVVGVKQHLPLQQDTGDPEQPVGDTAQGTAVGVTARPEGSVAAAALGVVQDGHPRPVEHSVAQPDLGGVAHRDDAALAAALGYGGHAREGSEGGVVPAADRPGSFGEQGREGDRADPGQRMQDGCVGRRTALWRTGPLTQACAQLIQLALGLMELAVGQAQAGHQRAQMQNSASVTPSATLMAD